MSRNFWRRAVAAYQVPIAIIGFLGAWEAASHLFQPPQYLLPWPSQILAEIVAKPGLYAANGWQTLYNTLWAFGLSTVIGVAMAIGIVYSKLLERSLYALLAGHGRCL